MRRRRVRTSRRACALLALVLTSACSTTTSRTVVRLRDPAEVALEIETPTGTQVVLPKSRTPVEAELPRTEPPYLGTALFEAHPMRTAGGGIWLRCDACVGYPLEKVVPDDGTIAYDGVPSDRLQWNADKLTMSVSHPYCQSGGRYCNRTDAYRVRFVTDMSNVKEIRHAEDGISPTVAVPIAILLDGAAAAALYGVLTAHVGSAPWVLSLVGLSALGAPILAFTAVAIGSIFTPPYEEVLYPR